MNQQKLANALRKLGEASYELADALLDQPSAADGGPVAATDSPPVAAPASTSEMPDFPEWEPAANPIVTAAPVDQREYVLGRCPTHDKPWTIKEGGVSKAGKSYSAFWKCSGKDADGSYCNKKPDASWAKTHDPESVLVGA